jgi:hypothetical protein
MKLVKYVMNEIGASKATQEGGVAIKQFKSSPLKHCIIINSLISSVTAPEEL